MRGVIWLTCLIGLLSLIRTPDGAQAQDVFMTAGSGPRFTGLEVFETPDEIEETFELDEDALETRPASTSTRVGFDSAPELDDWTDRPRWDDGFSESSRGEPEVDSDEAWEIVEDGEGVGDSDIWEQLPAIQTARSKSLPGQLDPDVTIYTTSWCPICKEALAYLDALDLQYTNFDIEKNADAKKDFLVKGDGGRGVPLIEIGGETMRGFSKRAVDAALERAR